MADFKVNDIIQSNLTLEYTKHIYPKYLVTEVMESDYLLFGLFVNDNYDDCLIQIEDCPYYHHIPKSWLERIPKPNRPQRTKQTIEAKIPQLVISRLGNDKIVIDDVSYKFNKEGKIFVAIDESNSSIARCHKRDEFDKEIGILVALARKYDNKLLETFALNQDKFKNILDLVKSASEEKNDK